MVGTVQQGTELRMFLTKGLNKTNTFLFKLNSIPSPVLTRSLLGFDIMDLKAELRTMP